MKTIVYKFQSLVTLFFLPLNQKFSYRFTFHSLWWICCSLSQCMQERNERVKNQNRYSFRFPASSLSRVTYYSVFSRLFFCFMCLLYSHLLWETGGAVSVEMRIVERERERRECWSYVSSCFYLFSASHLHLSLSFLHISFIMFKFCLEHSQ